MTKDIVQALIDKTLQELNTPPVPTQNSRVWKHPQGYKYLVQWSNTVLLRYFIRMFTSSLPKSEYRRKAQLDDAARSVVRNIEEGFKRSTTKEYIDFIGFSQGSLEEVKGDVRELTEDGFLSSKPGSSLKDLQVNLGAFNKSLSPSKGELKDTNGDYIEGYTHITLLYPPLKQVQVKDLSYEIFLEIINKTDFLLRKLVESLEQKLQADKKGYLVAKARIQEKFKK